MPGATILHICAMEGSLEVMEYVLTLPGINIDARDGWLETPLFLAAYWGWYEVFISTHDMLGNKDLRSFLSLPRPEPTWS